MEGSINNEALISLLQMQVEQLQAEVDKEIEGHKKANQRAAASEGRNKKLKEAIISMEADLSAAAYCWNCEGIGDPARCEKCGNNQVFEWNGSSFEWRGLPRKERMHD